MSRVHPVYRVSKSDELLGFYSLPFTAPIPRYLRRFACFIIVENDEMAFLGSGTLTTEGIVTAAHLFHFDFNKITVVLYSDYCHITRVPAMGVSINPNRDIAYVYTAVPKFLSPCLLPDKNLVVDKVLAFGCPQGIYGVIWSPKVVGYDKEWVVTQGLVIPGISGGGLYYKDHGKWYLVGVHSWGYLDTNTLYSVRLV